MVTQTEIKNFIENNYGAIYKTSGGGKKQVGGVNVTSWLKKILGNRVFDLYLKYPDTRESDELLWFTYLNKVHNLTPGMSFKFVTNYIRVNKISQSSILRAGRYFRAKFPEFARKKDSSELEEVFQNAFM